MAHPQIHTVCSDCMAIFKNAASVLSSKTAEEPFSLFNSMYRARLAANVSLSKCHMCMLLHASIPQLLEYFNPEYTLRIRISRDRHDRDAVAVMLVAYNRKEFTRQLGFPGSIRIQDGEKVAFIRIYCIKPRLNNSS